MWYDNLICLLYINWIVVFVDFECTAGTWFHSIQKRNKLIGQWFNDYRKVCFATFWNTYWSIFGYVGFILFIAIFISSICKFAYDDLFDKQTPNGISVSNNIDFMIWVYYYANVTRIPSTYSCFFYAKVRMIQGWYVSWNFYDVVSCYLTLSP